MKTKYHKNRKLWKQNIIKIEYYENVTLWKTEYHKNRKLWKQNIIKIESYENKIS